MLDFDTCLEAMKRRDPAYDGRFFVAVLTTRIYCRPVCRARMPLARNILFLSTAVAAEAAGFRACLRCRPDSPPFGPAWQGTRSTVVKALRLLQTAGLGALGSEALGSWPGMSRRQLRRLFTEHLGASPIRVDRILRVESAVRLLATTTLPISKIAAECRFTDSRRLGAAVNEMYGRSPSALRKHASRGPLPLFTNPRWQKVALRIAEHLHPTGEV